MENDKDLLKKAARLGYPLFETEEHENANETLADVVKSGDPRLWEGFAVMLANSGEKEIFDYDQVISNLSRPEDRNHLYSLLLMSLALYKSFHLKFAWAARLQKKLSSADKRESIKYSRKFTTDGDFLLGQVHMSGQKLKTTFQIYFEQMRTGLEDLLSARDELGLEYSLSQVFSPKQKDLFMKKLKREKLSKTEKEYYSRVVKKKILALANSQLHNLARRLIE